MNQNADAIIVGGGIAGAATAYYLAKAGLKPILCEKGEIAGEQSSRNWGFVRQQGRDPFEVPLMIECNRMWQGLSAELGTDLHWRQGGNLAMAADAKRLTAMEGWLEVARLYQLDSRILTNKQIRELIPGIEGQWVGGLYTPSDGQAEPAVVAPAFAQAARRLGAEIKTGCAVDEIVTAGGAVTGVRTERGELKAPVVICAAGAWSSRLLRGLGLSLPQLLIRGTVARTTPAPKVTATGVWGPEVAFRQRSDGSFNIAAGTGTDYDIVPDTLRHGRAFWANFRENRGLFDLHFGPTFLKSLWSELPLSEAGRNPFRATRIMDPPANPDRVANALAGLKTVFPNLGPVSVVRSWAGNIDATPDAIPVLGGVEPVRGLLVATGLSGHGFGMGPIVGRLMAELAAKGKTSLDIAGFRFSRFREGAALGARSVV
ncbi:NAD(P)/FAD-dependent oxidoreductase [Hypericibacter sp.]|uniref:NAD(P)/FAD-dependent oxidoreductase n=1 Tax=Hypericibacter sp. TaxID=2705401 RepID=UPI003D6D147B